MGWRSFADGEEIGGGFIEEFKAFASASALAKVSCANREIWSLQVESSQCCVNDGAIVRQTSRSFRRFSSFHASSSTVCAN